MSVSYTHLAALLSQKGLNVVTLPKTIDNDIEGTEMSFGLDVYKRQDHMFQVLIICQKRM